MTTPPVTSVCCVFVTTFETESDTVDNFNKEVRNEGSGHGRLVPSMSAYTYRMPARVNVNQGMGDEGIHAIMFAALSCCLN